MEISGVKIYAKPNYVFDRLEIGVSSISKNKTLNIRITGIAHMALAFLLQAMTSVIILKCAILIAGAIGDAYYIHNRNKESDVFSNPIFLFAEASGLAKDTLKS